MKNNLYIPKALLLTLASSFMAPIFAMDNKKQVIPMDTVAATAIVTASTIQPQCPAYNPVQPQAPRMDSTPSITIKPQQPSCINKKCCKVGCLACTACACAAVETGPSIVMGILMWCGSKHTDCCFGPYPEQCTPSYFKEKVVLTNSLHSILYGCCCYCCTRALIEEIRKPECE